MSTLGYRFDGDVFKASAAGEQELLERIYDALTTKAYSDPSLTTDEEREEAISMAFDGTHYAADFWSNVMAIMQQAPYEIDVKRIDSETATADDIEALDMSA